MACQGFSIWMHNEPYMADYFRLHPDAAIGVLAGPEKRRGTRSWSDLWMTGVSGDTKRLLGLLFRHGGKRMAQALMKNVRNGC